jgi:hypothetical protein
MEPPLRAPRFASDHPVKHTGNNKHRRTAMTTRKLAFRVVSFALLVVAPLVAPLPIHAAARVVQERAKVVVPGGSEQRISRIAFSGNAFLALGQRVFETSDGTRSQQIVYLFERTSATAPWVYVRPLLDTGPVLPELSEAVTMALQGNVAAIVWGTLYVHERSATGWNLTASLNGATRSSDVEIDAGTIVLSGRSCQWRSYRKNSTGQWRPLVNYGPLTDCSIVDQEVDISGTRIILANPRAGSIGVQFPSNVKVFDGLNTVSPTFTITSPVMPDSAFGSRVAVAGDSILATDDQFIGVHAFAGSTTTGWNHAATLAPADTYVTGGTPSIEMKGGLIAIGHPIDPQRLGSGSVEVQRRNADGTFTEIARLLGSDAQYLDLLGTYVQIDGRTIAAAARKAVYFFDLPTDLSLPPRIHETFNSGNAANWTTNAGSNFSVVTSGPSRVYRQTSVAGNATSIRTNLDWRDQSIQADVRPMALDGEDRWFGLVVRYQDPNNYYYVTWRSRDGYQLKKIVDGVVTPIVAIGAPFALGRTYRIGLQAIGTSISFFADGREQFQVQDTSLTHGSAGVMSYKMAADYDNIVISPTPLVAIMKDDFDVTADRWTTVGDGQWNVVASGSNNLFQQTSTEASARAITGTATRDQTVQVDASWLEFGAGPSRWFGLLARYVDDNNYYYVTIRNDNTVSLRKLLNGNIVVLGTAPYIFEGSPIFKQVRLEAIGTSLRVYIDDRPIVEATDSSFVAGRYGLAMYKASAAFDRFIATQQ